MAITDGRRDSGINTHWLSDVIRSPRFHLVAVICGAVLALAFIAGLFLMYRDQEKKLGELEAEKQQLIDRVDELTREKERLEGKLEYTKSLEGLLQYARDNLGYVFPDDTRIDDGTDGN